MTMTMTMEPNVNPETGIRYGIISANALDPEIIDEIQRTGRDAHWEQRLEELRLETNADVEDGLISEDEFDASLDRRIEECSDRFYDDEPVHKFEIDGVKGQTTWLGGALLVWIFKSPVISTVRLCSPCVPNAGNLDNPDPDGYQAYDVPLDWRYTE